MKGFGLWVLASWNVRTLLEVDGPLEIAQQRGEAGVAHETKFDQVVAELGRYKVDVARLQEMKWFEWVMASTELGRHCDCCRKASAKCWDDETKRRRSCAGSIRTCGGGLELWE